MWSILTWRDYHCFSKIYCFHMSKQADWFGHFTRSPEEAINSELGDETSMKRSFCCRFVSLHKKDARYMSAWIYILILQCRCQYVTLRVCKMWLKFIVFKFAKKELFDTRNVTEWRHVCSWNFQVCFKFRLFRSTSLITFSFIFIEKVSNVFACV